MSRNLKIIIILKIILWSIIIYTGYTVYNWLKDTYETEQLINNINEIVKVDISNNLINVNTDKINNINNDIKGWLILDGTYINYPILQTTNNDYYLNHSIDHKNNNSGWIFLDYRNNINELNKNTIIYGHNRINNTMFGSLKETLKEEWINRKNYIRLSTNNYSSLWEVFSVYHINKTNDYLAIDFNENEYEEFINLITNRSIYNFNNKPSTNDYIITLSSCYNDNERIVVHGKLIKKEGI